MKNLVIGLLVIGLTNLGYSQNSINEFVKSELEGNKSLALNSGVTATSFNKDAAATSLNVSYLNIVKEETASVHVKFLEDKAARFDVTELPKFDGRSESFKVIFKGNKGSIKATYDRKGNILTSLERFKNIKLPVNVRNSIYKEYPGWSTFGNSYTASYNEGMGVKKVYKVRIGKGNFKKNLKIDSDGNML